MCVFLQDASSSGILPLVKPALNHPDEDKLELTLKHGSNGLLRPPSIDFDFKYSIMLVVLVQQNNHSMAFRIEYSISDMACKREKETRAVL